jgi:histidinol-phosphate/aromatic aminotransferase/cobyric acid decarboxylase-like protein
MYHRLARRLEYQWKYIEDDPLSENDAVVISLPFADTGNKHCGYHELMRECSRLKIPVLVDCAYFGSCRSIEFDVAYNCITDITFSLSKTFPIAYARIGMRLTREDDDDTLFVYHKINYNNKIGAALGLKYLERFTPDYITSKYIKKQTQFCQTLNVEPSKTVLFGIGGKDWDQYNRGGTTNRLSFHKQYIKGLDHASTK